MSTALPTASSAYGPDRPSAVATVDNATPQGSTYRRGNPVQRNGAGSEYGILKGLHFHLILFFDGAIKDGRRDVYWAQKIGEYWVEVVTKGRGGYWNINANKQEFKRKGILGIGLIHKDEDHLFNNLKYRVIDYLCKSMQFVKAKLPDELASSGRSTIRRIRRGNYPKSQDKTGAASQE